MRYACQRTKMCGDFPPAVPTQHFLHVPMECNSSMEPLLTRHSYSDRLEHRGGRGGGFYFGKCGGSELTSEELDGE